MNAKQRELSKIVRKVERITGRNQDMDPVRIKTMSNAEVEKQIKWYKKEKIEENPFYKTHVMARKTPKSRWRWVKKDSKLARTGLLFGKSKSKRSQKKKSTSRH